MDVAESTGVAAAGHRWIILLTGLVAMTAGCTFQYGLAYMIPALRQQGLSLELASTLVACPTIGLLLTLIAWGAAADRWGERVVLATGLALAGAALGIAAATRGAADLGICLAVGGAAGGSVFAASGRLILGWFARHERGLAMGIRQSAQPLGVALAAATLPALGDSAKGTTPPLLFLGGFCLLAAALVVALVRDPPRPQATSPVAGSPERAASPYRQPVLWRIHAASALLVVPQFTVATFALVYLVDGRGWTALAAGRGQHQRPGVHRGRRVRRSGVGRPRARDPEHGSKRAGSGDATGPRARYRRAGIRRFVRDRDGVPGSRRRARASRRGAGAQRVARLAAQS